MVIKMVEIIKTNNLKKYFPIKEGLFTKTQGAVKAVDGISISINEKDIYAVVGETGSGKTTLGKLLIGLMEPTSGEVYFEGKNLFSYPPKERNEIRRNLQMIFQDPYGSLDPRFKVIDIIREPLKVNKIDYDLEDIIKIMEDVGLKPAEDYLDRYPHQLSGGQRQRVGIARALVLKPKFVVADEPVSMLDVSIRALFLEIILKLKEKNNMSFLFITHDFSAASYVGSKIGVLYLGKIVEEGYTDDIIKNPLHPYTQALLDAIYIIGVEKKNEIKIKGEIPNPSNIPTGCRFHPRCPYAMEICKTVEPELVEIEKNHFVACHLYGKK